MGCYGFDDIAAPVGSKGVESQGAVFILLPKEDSNLLNNTRISYGTNPFHANNLKINDQFGKSVALPGKVLSRAEVQANRICS